MGGAIIGYKLEQTRGFVLLACFLIHGRMTEQAEVGARAFYFLKV